MFFYKDTNSQFRLDDKVIPPGMFVLKQVRSGVVEMYEKYSGKRFLGPIEVTQCQRSDGTYYADFDEFILELGGLFF